MKNPARQEAPLALTKSSEENRDGLGRRGDQSKELSLIWKDV